MAGTGAENPPQGYSYVPDVAGGTAFMYHLTVVGHLITNLRIEETIGELASEVTIVIVTHNMQQAQRVSHYCAFFLAAAREYPWAHRRGRPDGTAFREPGRPQDRRLRARPLRLRRGCRIIQNLFHNLPCVT